MWLGRVADGRFSNLVDFADFSDLFSDDGDVVRCEPWWLKFPVLEVKELANEGERATRAMARNRQQ